MLGFYCALHGYQKPRQASDGLAIEPPYEGHLRRRTSFVAPEHSVAAEMAKSPGMVRDRPGAPKSASGAAIAQWLAERRGLSDSGARDYAGRMMALGILVPLTALPRGGGFSDDKNALYRIAPSLAPGGGGAGGAGAGAR